MNKKVIIGILIAIVVAGGFLFYLKSQDSTPNESSTTSESKKQIEGDELVKAVLDKVKAENPTVKSTRIVTEATDPNNLIGKSGEYQHAGVYFDTRTDYKPMDDELNTINIEDDDYGTTAGGSIEVFADEAAAKKRGELLEGFQTGLINAGAYRVVDNIVLRVSENYKASTQQEMLNLMESAL